MSCPTTGASGPSWPHPVIRPYTRRGFFCIQRSGPSPKRSITPGRNPSIRASACPISLSATSVPALFFKSKATERRPRPSRLNLASVGMPKLASSARSRRSTSAPISESNIAHIGAGPMPANSTTLYPDKTPMISPFCVVNLTSPAELTI